MTVQLNSDSNEKISNGAIPPVAPPQAPPPAQENSTPLSPRIYIGGPRGAFLQALHAEKIINSELAYTKEELISPQKSPIPPGMVPKYEDLLNSTLTIPINYRDTNYTLTKKCWEQLEWVAHYTDCLGIAIRWVMRGSACCSLLGSPFFKQQLKAEHPKFENEIEALDCRALDQPPLDVDLQARCIYSNRAYDVAHCQTLNFLYDHFRLLEFTLYYFPSRREKLSGFEALIGYLMSCKDRKDIVRVAVTNWAIPWMRGKEWTGENTHKFIDEILSRKGDWVNYQNKKSAYLLGILFESFCPLLFGEDFLTFRSNIEAAARYSIKPHDVENISGDSRTHLYSRVVMCATNGRQFDFTHFNSYANDSDCILSEAQNLYIELPKEVLNTQEVVLRWTPQATFDRSLGIFRVPKFANLREQWIYYCYALTRGELAPQKDLREKLIEAFKKWVNQGEKGKRAGEAFDRIYKKIFQSLDGIHLLFSYLNNGTVGVFSKEETDEIWNKYFPDSPWIDMRCFPTGEFFGAMLQLFALRFICSPTGVKQQSFLKARLTSQHGIPYVELFLNNYPILIPFDPVNALKVFLQGPLSPDVLEKFVLMTSVLQLRDTGFTELREILFPHFDHESWFNELKKLFALDNCLRDLGITLLHHSMAFADRKTVFIEVLKQSAALMADNNPTLRNFTTQWLIFLSHWSGLHPTQLTQFRTALLTAQQTLQAGDLYSFYLQLLREGEEPPARRLELSMPLPETSSMESIVEALEQRAEQMPFQDLREPEEQTAAQKTPSPSSSPPKATSHETSSPPKSTQKPVAKASAKQVKKETVKAETSAKQPIPPRPSQKLETTVIKPQPKTAVKQDLISSSGPAAVTAAKAEVSPPRDPPPLNVKDKLKELLAATNPNYDEILSCCSQIRKIPFEALLTILKKEVPNAITLSFCKQLYTLLIEQREFKKAKQLYDFFKPQLSEKFDQQEREFWLNMTSRYLALDECWKFATEIYQLFDLLSTRCEKELQTKVAELYQTVPCVVLETDFKKYARLLHALGLEHTESAQQFIVKHLTLHTTPSLLALIDFLEASNNRDLLTWRALLKGISRSGDIPLLRAGLQAGQRVLIAVDCEKDPQEWTALQTMVNRLFFLIYREEPTAENYTILKALWGNLSGPADFSKTRHFCFVNNCLKVFQLTQLNTTLIYDLVSWHREVTQEGTAGDHWKINSRFAVLIMRQECLPSFTPDACGIPVDERLPTRVSACYSLIDAVLATPRELLNSKYIKDAMSFLAGVIARSADVPLNVAVKLEKICRLILESHIIEYSPIAYVTHLTTICSRLEKTQPTLRQSLMEIACKMAFAGLRDQRDPPTMYDLIGVRALILALMNTDSVENFDQAAELLEVIRPYSEKMFSAAEIQLAQEKRILMEFCSTRMATFCEGVMEAFQEIVGFYSEHRGSTSNSKKNKKMELDFKKVSLTVPRSPAQELLRQGLLANLMYLQNIQGEIPSEILNRFQKHLDRFVNKIGENKNAPVFNVPRPEHFESCHQFLQKLLDLRPSTLDVSWLLMHFSAHYYRELYQQFTQNRDRLTTLLKHLCLHPSFQHSELNEGLRIQGMNILSALAKDKFIPRESAAAVYQVEIYFTGEGSKSSLLAIPIKEAIFRGVIATLLKIGTSFAIKHALTLLKQRYPDQQPVDPISRGKWLDEQRISLYEIAKAISTAAFSLDTRTQLVSLFMIYCSTRTVLFEDNKLYNITFQLVMEVLGVIDQNNFQLYHTLFLLQFDPQMGKIKTLTQPEIRLEQNKLFAERLNDWLTEKLKKELYQEDFKEILTIAKTLMMFTTKEVSWDLIEARKQAAPHFPKEKTEQVIESFMTCFDDLLSNVPSDPLLKQVNGVNQRP